MGNDAKPPRLSIFLEAIEMYVKIFYVIALIYPVGGLLWRWFSPTTKGFSLADLKMITPFILCFAIILIVVHLWRRKYSEPEIDSWGWRIFSMLIKPILWILSVLTLLTIIIDVHETFIANPRMAYPPPYDPQKFSIFLWKAISAFFGSIILLLLLYKREKKLKQRHRDS